MFSEDRGREEFTQNLQNLERGQLRARRVRSSSCQLICKETTFLSSEENFISGDILKTLVGCNENQENR